MKKVLSMADVFEWPCDKHYAHGGHYDNDGHWCSGVLAHPATQIGGAYTSW